MPASTALLPNLSISVVLADDSEIARISLRSMLDELPEIVVLGEACNGSELIDLCLRLHPDLALIDIRMPGMDGVEVTRSLLRDLPGIRVIMVSMMDHPAMIVEAIRAGASGYLLKDLSIHDLTTALHSVFQGKLYLSLELHTEPLCRQFLAGGVEPETGPSADRP